MKRKREVLDSRAAWREAARQLDAAIGIELTAQDRPPAEQVMDIRRFRAAVVVEREARERYVAALRADNKPVPDELVWDLSDTEEAGLDEEAAEAIEADEGRAEEPPMTATD